MILGIILLIIGITGFVKGRVNVTKNRELRGGGMYAVCTLFLLPLPVSFMVGLYLGWQAAAAGRRVGAQTVMVAGLLTTWAPVVVGLVLAFAMARPKMSAGQPMPGPRGFEVQMGRMDLPPGGGPG